MLLDQSVVQFRGSGGGDNRYLGVSSVQNVTLWTRAVRSADLLGWKTSTDFYDRIAKSKSLVPVLVGDKFKVIAAGWPEKNDFNMFDFDTPGTDSDLFDLTVNYPDHTIDTLITSLGTSQIEDVRMDAIDPKWTFRFVTTTDPGKKRAGLRFPPLGNFLYPDPAMEPSDYLCAALPYMMSARNCGAYGGMRTSEFIEFRGLSPTGAGSERIEFVKFGHWDLVLAKFLAHSPQWKRYCCVASNNDSFVLSVLCGDQNKYQAGYKDCDEVMEAYCNLETSKDDAVCGCYTNYAIKDDKERQIFESVKQVPNLHRVCMLSECNTADAYKNKANRDVKCPNTCIQVKMLSWATSPTVKTIAPWK